MRTIKQAYAKRSHGDIFEEEQRRITWQPLAAAYDSWTTTCLHMAEQAGEGLEEADLVVREPDSPAPPTREFKILNPKGQAHFLIAVPVLEIFLWVNKEHTETIHPDVVLAESLKLPATVVVDDTKGSIIHVRNGPTIVDSRTAEDRQRAARKRATDNR